jgi:hypothetical protein
MASEQRIIWTALPAGIRADQLTVRVHVAPRLTTSDSPATLDSFPDFQDWPLALADYEIGLEVSGVTTPITLSAEGPATSSTLWRTLFPHPTKVEPFAFQDMALHPVKSFSVGKVADAVIGAYGSLAANPLVAMTPPKTQAVADAAWQFIDPEDAPGRYHPTVGTPATNKNVAKMRTFFEPYAGAQLPPQDPPAPDFHQALAALAKYPSLPPIFGLVRSFTFTRPPKMPATGTMRLVVTRKTTPADAVTRLEVRPKTAFQFKYSTSPASAYFRPAPRQTKPEISAGRMILRLPAAVQAISHWYDAPASLLQFDVEGAVRKVETSGKASIGAAWAAATGTKDTPKSATMPALTTTGIRLIRNARETGLKAQYSLAKSLNLKASKTLAPSGGLGSDMTLYAEDVTRGWAVDVYDGSSSHWFKLCARDARYSLPGSTLPSADGYYPEEGFVTTAVTQAPVASGTTPSPTAPVNLHEGLFTWDGWSLVVQRPGSAILGLNADLGSDVGTTSEIDGKVYSIGQYELPEFPLTKEFRVPPGSLPRLRFGTAYRMRARAVDISGYASPFIDTPPSSSDLTASLGLVYRRFEPVPPPPLIPVEAFTTGESAYHLVVRSDVDTTPDAPSLRHILPPRTAQNVAEIHGGFDLPSGAPDPSMYETIASRERPFPLNDDGTAAPMLEIPDPVPYLPDPIASGAAFWNLPGTPKVTGADIPINEGAAFSGAKVGSTYVTTTKIDFDLADASWLDKRPFVLKAEGVDSSDSRVAAYGVVYGGPPTAPKWNYVTRVLGVAVPKGEQVKITMSSFTGRIHRDPRKVEWDLTTNGVFSWGMSRLSAYPAVRTLLDKLTRMGVNWLVSPFKTLTLTHAVKRPLIPPKWVGPKLMTRSTGQTWVELRDTQPVHAASTVKLDVYAEWNDVLDDPVSGQLLDGRGGRALVQRQQHAFEVPVVPGQKVVLDPYAMVMGTNVVLDKQPTAAQKAAIAALALRQRHYIGDTRYRMMRYRAVSTTRYKEFFSPVAGPFTRSTGDALGDAERVLAEVKVLSTARPDAPKLRWIVPSFGWDRSVDNRSVRKGGLRIFLDRPWYSSGDDELLGVVIWKPATTGIFKLEPYLSWTAHDPTWRSGSLGTYLVANDFPLREKTGAGLYLEEIGAYDHQVHVVGHKVQYDADRDLYFADIQISPKSDYWPFVRLALCRYQPNSIARCEASRVIIADFAQLAPDRTAQVVYGINNADATITVSGTSYASSSMRAAEPKYAGYDKAHLTVSIEGTEDRASDDPRAWVQLTAPVDLVKSNMAYSWSKKLAITGLAPKAAYRLAIREFEGFTQTTASGTTTLYGRAERLVYAETLPLTPPLLQI